MSKTYIFIYSFEGYRTIVIDNAKDKDDAQQKAFAIANETNCGELADVDMELVEDNDDEDDEDIE